MSRVKCSAGRFGWVVAVLLCLPDRAASFDLTPFVGPLPLGDQMIGHPHQLREADFNRDGILDFVISGDSGVVLLVNSGTNPPAITEARTLVSGVFSNLYGWYSIGDLDGDQWPDVIVASNHSDQLLWYRNSGAYPASFEAHVIDTAPGTDNLGPRAAEVGDIDGDDDLDIVCAIYGFLPARSGSPSGEVVWYENVAGDGSQWTKHTIEEIDLPEQIFVNDIDGDGDPDIFVGLHSRALVWYMNPGAPFDFKRRAVGPYGRPFDWTKFADLNGDGRTDIVTTITTGITWVENGGGTPTQWFPHLAYAIPAQTLDVGDLDGDGDSDIVITDEYYAKVAWYESTSGRRAGPGPRWGSGPLPLRGVGNARAGPPLVPQCSGAQCVLRDVRGSLGRWREPCR
jgi:hypothetical protein